MNADKRVPLGGNYNLTITDNSTNNSYSFTLNEEIGRGGNCLVYSGIQYYNAGSASETRKVVVREFYPSSIQEKITRNEEGKVTIDEVDTSEVIKQPLAVFLLSVTNPLK